MRIDRVLSEAIVEEVLRALEYPKVGWYVQRDLNPALWFEDLVVLAELVPGTDHLAGASQDPDDEEAAVEMTGLTLPELHSKSFATILANRRRSAPH
jgi:hypothetical protein